jgi:hypothetical protein
MGGRAAAVHVHDPRLADEYNNSSAERVSMRSRGWMAGLGTSSASFFHHHGEKGFPRRRLARLNGQDRTGDGAVHRDALRPGAFAELLPQEHPLARLDAGHGGICRAKIHRKSQHFGSRDTSNLFSAAGRLLIRQPHASEKGSRTAPASFQKMPTKKH